MAKKSFPSAWDLSELYTGLDDPQIEKDLKRLAHATKKFAAAHEGKIKTYGPAKLKHMLREDEGLESLAYRLDLFVSLRGSLDTLDGSVAALQQKITSLLTENANRMVFASLELAKHPKLKEYAATDVMGIYRIVFQRIVDHRKHQLDEPREQLLNTKSVTAHAGWQEMFEKVVTKIKVELPGKAGKPSRQISVETALDMLHISDKVQRHAAGAALSKAFQENQEVLTHIYSMIVTDKMQNDQIRHFENPEDSRHLANGLEPAAVASLQSVTDGNMELVARYYRIKRKLLGLKKLTEYDRYVPLDTASRHTYSFTQGVAEVARAFREFDPEFEKHFLDIIAAKHVDALPSPKKRGGAFCVYSEKCPYIFLNYFGKPRDVQTLAHEAGHGIHSILSGNLPLSVRHAPIAMAETASVFAEMIVFQKVFAAASTKTEKISLLSTKIEEFFSTIFRQMAMYRFEQLAHGAMKKQGQIAASQLHGFWLETQRAMFGDSVELSENYQYWWEYISHFYAYPFYVYGYSFGGLLVLSLYEAYKREGQAFIPKYKRFLALGGSKSPQEAVREFGYDLSDPDFWEAGVQPLRAMIDQLESLI